MKLSQLSLRELFLLVALAAMGCGWLASELRWRAYAQSQQRELVKHAENMEWLNTYLREQNFNVTYDPEGFLLGVGTSSRDEYTNSLFREVQSLKARIKSLESTQP